MKVIKYNICTRVNHGTEENPDYEDILSRAEIHCRTQAQYNANYPIVEKEAAPGTIVVSGEFETVQPTQLDLVEAQVAYTAMMTDTLMGGNR